MDGAALALALVASKWIWKSQCNERGGRDRAGKGGRAEGVQKMFLASALAHSPPSGKWIESLSVHAAAADAFYSPEPLADFFSARSTSPSEVPYLAVHFRVVIVLPLNDD